MTHLNRIFMQKTSVPVSISRIFSLPSASFGTNDLNGNGMVSKPRLSKASETNLSKRFGALANNEKINSKDIEKITGISISPCGFGWAQIDLVKKSLVNFGGHILTQKTRENIKNPLNAYNVVHEIIKKVPDSDLYIMESYKYYKVRSFTELEIQFVSMLIVLLNSGCESTGSKIFIQKNSVVDILFELKIGEERVSPRQKIQRILGELQIEKLENGGKGAVFDFPCISELRLKGSFLNLIYNSNFPLNETCALAFLLILSFIQINVPQMKLKNS